VYKDRGDPMNPGKRNRIGVLLSGCGFLDGSEIHEAVLTMLHLDRAGAETVCIAPRAPQAAVVDHFTQQAVPGSVRNVLEESARIARGRIQDLAEVDPEALDGLILPGGYGAAKNLCDFALAGAQAKTRPDVTALLRAMHAQKKPIGAICIAPAAVAAALRGVCQPTLTIGEDHGVAAALQTIGSKHENCPVTGFVVDERNRIVTTPAYMYDARISDVSAGIEKLVQTVLKMIAR
jgi:enhancing lycopene biosynthesis protein 2